MAYPLSLPEVTLFCRKFSFEIPQQESITDGLDDQVVDNGNARWVAEFDTSVLRGADFKLMRAWELATKKARATVLVHDTRCIFPFHYQGSGWTGLTRAVGGAAFDGTCTLASIGSDGFSLGLSGLPYPFKLTSGDPLSFLWDTSRYAYHTLGPAGDVASTSGGLTTVTVDPATLAGYGAGATVHLEKPTFLGRVIQWSKAERDDNQMGNWSFTIRQKHTRAS
jgi:hypothetical protein